MKWGGCVDGASCSTTGPRAGAGGAGGRGIRRARRRRRGRGATDRHPVQHHALRKARSLHEAEADGQRYAVDPIAHDATLRDGTLRVQVYGTRYPPPTCMDAADAPHETLRVYLRRAARLGLPHTSADPPPPAPSDASPSVGAATGSAAVPLPAVRA